MKQSFLPENNAKHHCQKNTQRVEGSVHLMWRIPLMSQSPCAPYLRDSNSSTLKWTINHSPNCQECQHVQGTTSQLEFKLNTKYNGKHLVKYAFNYMLMKVCSKLAHAGNLVISLQAIYQACLMEVKLQFNGDIRWQLSGNLQCCQLEILHHSTKETCCNKFIYCLSQIRKPQWTEGEVVFMQEFPHQLSYLHIRGQWQLTKVKLKKLGPHEIFKWRSIILALPSCIGSVNKTISTSTSA
jgi:hypothetical protein